MSSFNHAHSALLSLCRREMLGITISFMTDNVLQYAFFGSFLFVLLSYDDL